MSTTFEKVAEFHQKFGLPTYNADRADRADILPISDECRDSMTEASGLVAAAKGVLYDHRDERAAYSVMFILEELEELMDVIVEDDLVEIADALADLDYVVAGTSHFYELPHDEVVAEVHRSNMEKERGTTEKRDSGLDIRKPEGWRPPDIARVLTGS